MICMAKQLMNKMEHLQVPLSATKIVSKLTREYLNEDEKLASFYQFSPNLNGLHEALSKRQFNIENRKNLVQVLSENYQRNHCFKENKQLINRLLDEKTFTVTTGHQLSLFSGPLYFIYKIISCINLAKRLNQTQSKQHVIPIFWMATEDHDFEEINHFYYGNIKMQWPKESTGYCGTLDTKGLDKVLEDLCKLLPTNSNSKELKRIFEEAYLKNSNLADASFALVNILFKNEDLLILDANHPLLKRSFLAHFQYDLKGLNFESIAESTSKLNELGYKSQVEIKPLNTFLRYKNVRVRIDKKNNDYELYSANVRFTEVELFNRLKEQTEDFSPNVLLRPMYQEFILPNIAYLGGGAEVAYWLQLKSTFDKNKISFPVVMLRNSALILSSKAKQKMQQIDLNLSELFVDRNTLVKEKILSKSDKNLELGDFVKDLQQLYDNIEFRASMVDSTLKFPVRGAANKAENMLLKIQKKMIRAEKKNQDVQIQKLEYVLKEAFPQLTFQERLQNFSFFYSELGPVFLKQLLMHLDPLNPDLNVFVINQ